MNRLVSANETKTIHTETTMTTRQILSTIHDSALEAAIDDDRTAGYKALDALDKQLDEIEGKCSHNKKYDPSHRRNRLAGQWLDVQVTVSDAMHSILIGTTHDHASMMAS